MQPRGPFSLQTHGRATRRPCRALASPCCPWRPTLWTKCGATRDPLYLLATSTASQRSSQVRLPPISARSEEGHALSPPHLTPGSSWQEKVAGIRQQMEEHTRSPTALLLSGLEETACE